MHPPLYTGPDPSIRGPRGQDPAAVRDSPEPWSSGRPMERQELIPCTHRL